METPARKKKGGRLHRSLSDRLRFRPRAFSTSTLGNATESSSKASSAAAVMEPRDSVATSGESEASTMGASPIVERVLVSRESRSCSTSAAAAGGFGAASTSRQRRHGSFSSERKPQAPAAVAAAAATTRGADVGAGLSQGERGAGEIKVMFRRHEFSSTRGKGLGLTVSPAKDIGQTGRVPRGARIEQAEGCTAEGVAPHQASTPLRPGDLLAQVNGRDVRRLPFSEVLRMLNAPTPHLITTTAPSTTTTIGSMFGSSSNSGSPARSHATHPGNVPKILRGSLSSAPVGPRTPGSGNGQCTAPPSTNRSRAPLASTPPSPAAAGALSPLARPGSPLRLGGSSKTPRGIAPLLTDFRRKSWRRKFSGRWGSGGKKGRARGKGSKTCTGAASFFSSTEATPTNAHGTFWRRKAAASFGPWEGETAGGGDKPSRMHRTRSMFNSTLGRMSPRGMLSPWATEALETKGFNAVPTVPPPPVTPQQSPLAAPPSPAGTSPLEVPFDARPDGPVLPRTAVNDLAPLPSPRVSLRGGTTHVGGAGAAVRRRSNLRYALSLPQGDGWFGGAGTDDSEEEEEEEESVEEYSVGRRLSRETAMSSSSAFFPSDSEDEFFAKGDNKQVEEEEEEEEEEKEEQHRRRRRGRPLRRGSEGSRSSSVDGAGTKKRSASPTPPKHQQPDSFFPERLDAEEVSLAEQEEDEIVALSSYLACAARGWPWDGQDVLWAEYVALSGQHRWIRADNCRHALLLVPGALYLLELPKEAVTRYMSHGLSTRVRGSWHVRLDASDLSHLSVPLTPQDTTPAAAAAAAASARSCSAATSEATSGISNRFESGSGMILHKKGRGGASAWVECRSAASRDALVDLLSTWAQHAEKKGKGKGKAGSVPVPALRVDLRSVAELSAEAFCGGRPGRTVPSLTDERQKCLLW